ncbi:alpha/beta hydrolase [Streptomyces roseirectus]|uniref:alpha/beta hydrolase n=1 Tax=Streptomyces roseirectus TaxID=2768066 RepID=UPI0031B58572
MTITSGLTWPQLRDLKLSELTDAADGWNAASKHAGSARERVDGDMSGSLAKTQESESATAAVKRLKRLSENYHYIHTECALVRASVEALGIELAAPQKQLRDALEDAAANCYTVHADGRIDYPAGGKNAMTGELVPGGTVVGNNGLIGSGNSGLRRDGNGMYSPGMGPGAPALKSPNPHLAKAQEIADRIARALREAREIDDRYNSALGKLKAAPGLTVDTRTWADVAADVNAVSGAAQNYLADHLPFDKSPADRKEWWDHLSEEQREEYLTSFPDVIGNLDGIPSAVRDEANRENLTLLIAKLDGQPESKDMLAGLKGIQTKLQETVDPPMYLLGIGDRGNGRAIVSYGDPDTSKNVAAYVPGLGTKLDKDFANGTLDRALYTKMGADRHDSDSTASIVWLGYDAPQSIDVASTTSAEHGAPDYNSFMDGITATNGQKDLHLTAIGHSYGSRMVGEAAMRPGGIPGADDIILLGSPGTGADNASQLNVGADHVFVGSAQNDPVTWLPSKAGVLTGPVLSTLLMPEHDQNWFGTDPASEAFGGRRFKVADGPLPIVAGQGPTPAHSNYFNPAIDPASADNIARIVAGKSDSITTEAPR